MKIYMYLLLILCSSNSFSQFSKGKWLIGGTVSFDYSEGKNSKISTLQFSPAAGYFFINKLAGGLRLNYATETFYYTTNKNRNIFTSLTPFLRYYFLPKEQKINLFADASYGYAWGKYKHFVGPDYTYNSSTFSLLAGPAIFLNEHTSLEFTVGYSHISRGTRDTTPINRFQFGVGLQVFLGKR